MLSDNLLIVFIKNPVLGKVKTRLAKTIGDEKALSVYLKLLNHTLSFSKKTTSDKAVFYSHKIESNDNWFQNSFLQFIQEGDDLGDKMLNAFEKAFSIGYKKVVIIGSDCFELNDTFIAQAFNQLNTNDVVIGPANDGGYYLLGMKKLHAELFKNKEWSTKDVFRTTITDISKLNLSCHSLDVLSDIDNEDDLLMHPQLLEV